MSSLSQIRTALAETISEGVDSELLTYDTVPDVAQLPAAVIRPRDCNFAKAFNRGLDEWDFDIFVLVGRTDTQGGQEQLDGFIAGAGPDSIREVLFNNPTMGLADSDAFVKGMSGYGGEFNTARITHVGAILKVVVRTVGSA